MQLAKHFQAQIKFLMGLLAFFLISTAITPPHANASAIDFTRHLSQHSKGPGKPVINQYSFFAVPGRARLVVTGYSKEIKASIQINGKKVVGTDSFSSSRQLEVPITLVRNNTISVTLSGAPASSVSIRVKQIADVELHVGSRLHFNTNVSNFVAAREFYGKLGFETLMGYPDTNTQEMAQALGIKTPTAYDGSKGETAGGYLLHAELLSLNIIKGGATALKGGLIDLIEFTTPRNKEPPYAQINHLGIARVAMHTTNIAADYKYMKNAGVEFISTPISRSDGTIFAIFSDLDGAHYELIEVEGEDVETENTHIVSLAQVNINVSDFERSRAWYQMIGYNISRKLAPTDSIEVANAMGFNENFMRIGAILTHQTDDSTLELVQWINPYNPDRAYNIPVNHLGINRIAFASSDLAADVATLKSQGVEFLSDITPCCAGPQSSGSIVMFYDPDGAIIELVEQSFSTMFFDFLKWFINNRILN